MTPSAEERRARAIQDAAAWIEQLESGSLSASERAEFADWLRASPINVAEMLRAERLRAVLRSHDRWQYMAAADPQDMAPEVVDLHPVVPPAIARTESRKARGSRGIHQFAWAAAIAAAVVMVAVGVGLYRSTTTMTIEAKNGERREVTLSEGSIVRVSPNTIVHVSLGGRTRSVVIDRGEALFLVAKDPARPFIVAAARTQVRAVGTAFYVRREGDDVTVTVQEGKVAVRTTTNLRINDSRWVSRDEIPLTANQRVSVSPEGVRTPVQHVETYAMDKSLDWGANVLEFESARVDAVVADFNRRNPIQIRIADESLAKRTVSGIFRADDPGSFVDFLVSIGGVVRVQTPEQIVIEDAATGSAGVER